jgi:hypothetical protein
MKRWHALAACLAAVLTLALFRALSAPKEVPPRRAACAPGPDEPPALPTPEDNGAAAAPGVVPETPPAGPAVVAVVAPPPAQVVAVPAPGAPPIPETGEDPTEAWVRIAAGTLTEEEKAIVERHLARFVRPQAAGEDRERIDLLPNADDPGAVERRRVEQLELLRQRNALGLLDRIASGLAWLALHQGPDGAITESSAAARCAELGHQPACVRGHGRGDLAATAATGLAIVAMLDFRDQDKRGIFEPTLARAVTWLRGQQRNNGTFPGRAQYATAISLLALGQAAASSGRDDLRAAVQHGLEKLCVLQGRDGGHRYSDMEDGDLSVTAWVAQAVEAARRAKVEIPADMEPGLRRFLDAVWVRDSVFLYTAGGMDRASLYPAGILLGLIVWDVPGSWRCSGDQVRDSWREWVAQGPPRRGRPWGLYSLYYGVRVACALEPELPKAWSQAIRELAAEQAPSGSRAGSFGETLGYGVVIDTAFATLTLEHALYQR